ncbi:hypothetical protein A5906_07300 [Bradyrhizobium sacchari]|uniref:Uncharacterized protein n=1 Tax=Bradyrhizobium sacchari TaxID=1399419 RepID=A0A560KKQ9_9BRAD|nr:hypothetical protein [Bradyrhizobium sacchari]OPY95766.1 hypothetical protein A5906_07300 [Bradyrhizobium sacchari]TWB66632.1 hypothetical protein FBZ94_101308 [Bradyrhizobium sacchari]TWB83868.1 hypothetical protein FBZ95_101307 [Bradyrhizobium sacchari]
MADEAEVSSELSKIAKLNGDFRKNYGTLLGAILYLRSISVVRRRTFCGGVIVALLASIAPWLAKVGWSWFCP